MIPIEGQPILTAEQMRAAEEAAAPTPDAKYALMERAGAGIADAVRRLAAGAEVLVLCGPGNNGGDGYVAARILREQGHPVRIAALTPPRTALARRSAATWDGPTDTYTTGDQARRNEHAWKGREVAGAPVVVDALFGTGGREDYGGEAWLPAFAPLLGDALRRIAVDLPLGRTAAGDRTGSHDLPAADLTLALGAVKPAHVLPSGRAACGEIRLIDLGLDLSRAPVRVAGRPARDDPRASTHKYTRGMVGVLAGAMPGAAILAASAAARAGAGYVAVFGDAPGGPAALVRRPLSEEALADRRLGAVIVGPGLGRDAAARRWLEWLIRETQHPLVVDGDALHLLDPASLKRRYGGVVMTPHAGEHRALIATLKHDASIPGDPFGTSIAQAALLGGSWDVVVAKGATTVVADHRQAIVSPGGNPWLSTAGTGDVLAGAIAAMVASGRQRGVPLIDAAAAGVWLHADAARRCGASFVADDLAHALTAARAGL